MFGLESILAPLHNQLVGGGLVLMATGSIIALLRNIPGTIYDKIKSQCLVSVTVVQTDPLFDWITIWLAAHPYSKKTRRIKAATKEESHRVSMPEVLYSPAKGEHFFFYQRKLIWLTREKEGDQPTSGGGEGKDTPSSDLIRKMMPEQYTFRTVGRSQEAVRSLINDVLRHTVKEREEKTCVYVSSSSWWEKLFSYEPRPLSSVFLDGGKKENILADMTNFRKDKEWYLKRGVPYSRKYLFYGPPGNGKTSIIGALAGELNLNLYVLNLSAKNMDDSDLFKLVREVKTGSLLLLEDIDAAVPSRTNVESENANHLPSVAAGIGNSTATKDEDKKGVTLSGLLNILDGVLTPSGLMVVMTTNRPQVLDPALTRPGRVDMGVEFSYATKQQILDSFAWFYPERGQAEEFSKQFTHNTSMATIQQKLMELREEEKNA